MTTALQHRLGGYREYAPGAGLAAFAEAVWVYRHPYAVPNTPPAFHRVLPDPALSLAFSCYRDAEGRPVAPRLHVIGPKTKPYPGYYPAGYEIAAIKLKLEWVRPLLGLTPAEHADALSDATLAVPVLAGPLFDALVETRTAEAALRILAETLGRRAFGRQGPRAEVAGHALDLVRRTNGQIGVEAIAGRLGLSPRHLRRTVGEAAGLSLKAYARTVRFLAAMTAADREARPAWARLALDAGFCDQSHLVRDCRALCSLTPEQLHRERRAEAEMSNTG